ncbi:MAG: type VI secretion system lipoprotein TssJ, partial [Pseudomonadota bacterium]
MCLKAMLLAFLLSACNPKAIPTVIFPAKPEVPEPAPVVAIPGSATVNIFARDIVNPAPDGTASPVQVRIFLTDDAAVFDDVSFEQVFEFEGQSFDLAPKLTSMLTPGSLDSVVFDLEPEESTIAIAVAFRDIGRTEWLKLVRIDARDVTGGCHHRRRRPRAGRSAPGVHARQQLVHAHRDRDLPRQR